jgi:hypothetical protein
VKRREDMKEVIIYWLVIIPLWLLFYYSKRVNVKLKLCMPFINLLFWLMYLIKSIYSYSESEPTLEGKVRLFFHNDSSMLYTFFIFPNILIGTVIPLLLIFIIKVMEMIVRDKN